MTGRHEMRDTVARALCRKNSDEPCKFCLAEARLAVSALVLAGYIQLDIQDLIEASSLGTPGAKALRASVSDERAQRAIDLAHASMCECYEFNGDNLRCPVHSTPQVFDEAGPPPPVGAGEPDHACLIVDKDNDIWRFGESQWECQTVPAYGPWVSISGYHGPFLVYAPQTGDGAGASPAATSAAPLDPAAQAGEAIGSPAPSSPRLFELVRSRDISGVTGTGVVAEGVEWTDKTATLRWHGEHPATAVWPNVEEVLAIHGHEGATVVRWLDGAE